MAGRKIAAHAHGTQGIKNAILAGIDSIEHASLIDDEGIRLAKEHGVYLVMDIYNDDYIPGQSHRVWAAERKRGEREDGRQAAARKFERAVKGGAKMAFGTDAGVYRTAITQNNFFTW